MPRGKNGVVLYRNGDHLSGAGALSISYIFDPFFAGLTQTPG